MGLFIPFLDMYAEKTTTFYIWYFSPGYESEHLQKKSLYPFVILYFLNEPVWWHGNSNIHYNLALTVMFYMVFL